MRRAWPQPIQWNLRRSIGLGLVVAFVGLACSTNAETPSTPEPARSLGSQVWSKDNSSPKEPATTATSPPKEPAPVAPSPIESIELAPTVTAQPGTFPLLAELSPNGTKAIDASEFHQIFSRDWIFPIYSPTIARATDVELRTDELVMGVTVNGESRAYPLESLRGREMVNDELGGLPILVTF